MIYYPLQFFTILQASALITSLIRVGWEVFPEVRLGIVIVSSTFTILGWLCWYISQGEALHCKAGAGAIAVGAILGLWL
jgi:hypothetical protein